MTLTDKEEAFCKAYALNGGNATDAWREVSPKSKAKPETVNVLASRMVAKDKVRLRIAELKDKVNKKAEAEFTITVEQRLKWLKEITEAGLGKYIDQAGNDRRENLAASRAAIATMNDMLGGTVAEEHKPIEIRLVRATKVD